MKSERERAHEVAAKLSELPASSRPSSSALDHLEQRCMSAWMQQVDVPSAGCAPWLQPVQLGLYGCSVPDGGSDRGPRGLTADDDPASMAATPDGSTKHRIPHSFAPETDIVGKLEHRAPPSPSSAAAAGSSRKEVALILHGVKGWAK